MTKIIPYLSFSKSKSQGKIIYQLFSLYKNSQKFVRFDHLVIDQEIDSGLRYNRLEFETN